MRFNYQNQEKVNDLYIHDSDFEGFCYDYDKRQIKLSCKNLFLEKIFHFTFDNVIYSGLQSCTFWHGGNSIYDIYLEDNLPEMDRLMEIQNANSEMYAGSRLDDGTNYIPVKFEINSGDTLLIICEAMECEEEKLKV